MRFILVILLVITSIEVSPQKNLSHEMETDVCVYAGTASGIMAAVASARNGANVLIVEPSRWLGGMTGGGISTIDWGNEHAVGGTTLQVLEKAYNNSQYRSAFKDLVRQYGIEVIYEHRLSSVSKEGTDINSISLDLAPPDSLGCPIPYADTRNHIIVKAKVFIDCSYEGDLMAKSGVSYAYGRESREHYDESLAGAQENLNVYKIDPFKVEGDTESGLLPFLQDIEPQTTGSEDKLTMGYCLRYKFDLSGKGIPIPEPGNYNPEEFEMFRRGFENGLDLSLARYMKKPGKMKEKKGYFISGNGAGNTNRSILTTTIWGINTAYPEGSWEVRSNIWKFHQDYFKGIVHFLRTDPSVPQHLKEISSKASFSRGIFDETGGWPHQLYVREARRMISGYVITQHDIDGTAISDNSIGLASYGIDEWPYALIPFEGDKIAIYGGRYSEMILNEKDESIYKIPYQSIVPKAEECTNLIVPVCISASHIAMTSIRMEPVWMIIGESAGTAAAMAIEDKVRVQDVNYAGLREKLLKSGQKLELPERNIAAHLEPGKSVSFRNSSIELQFDADMRSTIFYK